MKKISGWIRILLIIIFLFILFHFVKWEDFIFKFSEINVLFLTLSFLMIPVMIILSCLKWNVILKQNEYKLSLIYLMHLYMIGYFFTNLFPSNVGGDIVRSYYLGRRIGSQNFAAVSVFLERLSGLLVLLILGALTPVIKHELYLVPTIAFPSFIAALTLFSILIIGTKKSILPIFDRIYNKIRIGTFRLNEFFFRNFAKGFNDRIDPVFEYAFGVFEGFQSRLMHTILEIKIKTGRMITLLMITILFYILTVVNIYFAFRTFGVHPDLIEMSAVVPIALLINLLPVSHGNLGFAEGVYVFYFSLVGIDPSASMAMAFFMRFKLICSGFIGYILYITYKEKKHDLHIGKKLREDA